MNLRVHVSLACVRRINLHEHCQLAGLLNGSARARACRGRPCNISATQRLYARCVCHVCFPCSCSRPRVWVWAISICRCAVPRRWTCIPNAVRGNNVFAAGGCRCVVVMYDMPWCCCRIVLAMSTSWQLRCGVLGLHVHISGRDAWRHVTEQGIYVPCACGKDSLIYAKPHMLTATIITVCFSGASHVQIRGRSKVAPAGGCCVR